MTESSLYERLGGAFAIAAVVDHFSDAIVKNPIVGQTSENPALREWHTNNLERLPGLKFMRTLWVCEVAGGPQQYAATQPGSTTLGLEEAHRELKISPAEFDEVAAELGRTLDFFKVPEREKEEVLAAFAAHKGEVTEGYSQLTDIRFLETSARDWVGPPGGFELIRREASFLTGSQRSGATPDLMRLLRQRAGAGLSALRSTAQAGAPRASRLSASWRYDSPTTAVWVTGALRPGQTGLDPIFQGAADFDLELIERRTLDGHTQELIYRPTLHV